MVKGLITEQYLKDIGDAIREKTGENSVYYPSEMANAIINIPTGGGGLELTTSLTLSSDIEITTNVVTLSALLKANYDDLTPSDIDLDGFLKNAPVKLYDSNDTLLDTGVTNDSGVVIFNKTISTDTTFYCVFSGTSDYEACISNEVTVEITYLFYDACDSSKSINNYGQLQPYTDTRPDAMYYDSAMKALKVHKNTSDRFSLYPINALTNYKGNLKITFEEYYDGARSGFEIMSINDSNKKLMIFGASDTNRDIEFYENNVNLINDNTYVSGLANNKWIKIEILFDQTINNKVTVNYYDEDVLSSTVTYDILESNENGFYFGLGTGFYRNTNICYRNIAIEPL